MNLLKQRKLAFSIVDDNNLFCKMLSYSINELYSSTIETYNSVESLIADKKRNSDFILLDHFLPGAYGIDSIEIIKQIHPSTNIIVISSQGDSELVSKVVNNYGCLYLSKKEFTIKRLSELIGKHIN